MQVLRLAAGAFVLAALWWHTRVASDGPRELNIVNFDAFAYYYPTFRYAFDELWAGRFPLWNPYQLCGTPFFANAQHLLLYPLNTLYLLLPTAVAMRWSAILHVALAVVFMAVLARVRGLGTAAAVTAGVAFAFCGAVAGLIFVPHHLYGAVWLPLALALADRVLRADRARVAACGLAIVLASQYLGGYPLFCLFTAYVIAGWWAWWLVTAHPPRATVLRRSVLLAGAAGVALLLAGLQLVPAAELARLSPRSPATLSVAAGDPMGAAGLTRPLLALRDLVVPAVGVAFPRSVGIGLIGFCLALVGVGDRLRRADAVFFALLAVASFVLALGVTTPVYGLYFHLPTGSWFRGPARFLFLTSFALAMLAGIGVDALGRRWPRAAGLLPVLVTLELFLAFRNRVPLPETHPDLYALPPAIVDYLRAHQGWERTYFAGRGPFPVLPAKAGMASGIFAVADRENVFPVAYADWTAFMETGAAPSAIKIRQGELEVDAASPRTRLLDLMSAAFVVESAAGEFTSHGGGEALQLVHESDGYRIYRNLHALPRAYLVDRLESAPTRLAALERLASPGFPARTTVVLEQVDDALGIVPGTDDDVGTAEIVDYAAERVRVRTRAARPSLLVLTDEFYPGWTAAVDGTPTPIVRANVLFRGVPVPAGEHEVLFTFQPTLVGWALP